MIQDDESCAGRRFHQAIIGIAHFHGGMGRMWYFSASHDRLVLELSHETDRGIERRYLVLAGCDNIAAPVMWRIENIAITALPIRDELRWYELSDEGVRVTFRDCMLLDRFEP